MDNAVTAPPRQPECRLRSATPATRPVSTIEHLVLVDLATHLRMRSYFPTTLALTVTRFCDVGILEASLLGRSFKLACGEAARASASYLMKACCHDRTIV
jgi:hypothetical protein